MELWVVFLVGLMVGVALVCVAIVMSQDNAPDPSDLGEIERLRR